MNPLNPLFALVIFLIAYLTAYLIQSGYKIRMESERYECVDGMRGFLALGVFIHHGSIWHQYLQTGNWLAPNSNFYNHLGQTSVTFFFMITSFLFVSKLLHSREKKFNWSHFFISRIFRIAPLYYFSILILVLIVLIISGFELQVNSGVFVNSLVDWSLFTIEKTPLINDCAYTTIINAGVIWSLPYEWLFYFALPLISLAILKQRPNIAALLLGVAFSYYFYIHHDMYAIRYNLYPFIGGAIAPVLLKFTDWNKKIDNTASNLTIILCLILIVQFKSTRFEICLILIAIVFTLVGMGCTLFGLLKNSTLKFLGEICYSTYLLHGITIFTVFYFGFGLETMKGMSPWQYCLTVFAITPLLIIVSFFGFRFIEKPFMDLSKRIIGRLKLREKLN